jgi:hypothetical protein
MDLPVIVLVAAGLWFGVLGLFVSLCKAARTGDQDMVAASRGSAADAQPRPRPPARARYHLRTVADSAGQTAESPR